MSRPVTNEHDGDVALVVGGSSGIGRATCVLLAARGARVAVSGPDQAGNVAVEQAITAAGGTAVAVRLDVTDEASVRDGVDRVVTAWGGLDILVTSAGIQRYGDAVRTDPAVWDEVFAVNVRGSYLAFHAALPHLRRSRHGAGVLVSSVQASMTQQDVAAYTASKGALLSFTRSLAVDEARHGVRVNCVCPGSVDTEMLRESARLFSDGTPAGVAATLTEWGGSHALGRIGRAEEVAELISFLAGDRASFITGEDIRVDGGLLARLPAALPTVAAPATGSDHA